MQSLDQDNSDMPHTDDVAETFLSDFDEAARDDIKKTHQHYPMPLDLHRSAAAPKNCGSDGPLTNS